MKRLRCHLLKLSLPSLLAGLIRMPRRASASRRSISISALTLRRSANAQRFTASRMAFSARSGKALRSGWPTSLSHNRLRIQGASIDYGGDFPVANQDNEQIRDHGSFTFRIEGVREFFLVELGESVFYDAHGAFHDHASGGNHCAGRLLAKHSARDLRRVGEVGDSCFKH